MVVRQAKRRVSVFESLACVATFVLLVLRLEARQTVVHVGRWHPWDRSAFGIQLLLLYAAVDVDLIIALNIYGVD